MNPGDFSNWFSPNRRAIEGALWTAGFRSKFLAAWGDRVAYKGTRLPYVPEYLLQTYEGLKWTDQPDGTKSFVPYSRDQAIPLPLEPIAGPPVRPLDSRELQITLDEELSRLRPQVTELHAHIAKLYSRIAVMQNLLRRIQRGRVYRFLRFLGRWDWFGKGMAELEADSDSPSNGKSPT